MGIIQSLGFNILNKFLNEAQHNTSSSTSHIPTKESATFAVTPNGHIESEDFDDGNAIDDYSSGSAYEFQNKDANYDTSSSFDDEEEYDSNSNLLGFNNIGTYHYRFLLFFSEYYLQNNFQSL